MTLFLLISVTLVLAAANGANDNIKGAATLLGSGLMGYRAAITFATVATAVGGVVSIYLVNGLLGAFSGKGIVPDEITASLPFLLSVATGAALTVWLATWIGMPISTTHALLGGLFGAGLAAVPLQVDVWNALRQMLLPLLLSPLVALALALVLAPMLARMRKAAARGDPCVCSETQPVFEGAGLAPAHAYAHSDAMVTLGDRSEAACRPAPGRAVVSLPARLGLDRAHLASAAAVSFARGLNDTPKIAALMFATGTMGVASASTAVVVAMAAGGVLAARRVGETLAFRVTRMDAGEGLGGNLVTAALVIGASRLGLPVSTTHVSTGALFGIAAGNGSGRVHVIRSIVLAWLVTLPLSGLLAFAARSLLS